MGVSNFTIIITRRTLNRLTGKTFFTPQEIIIKIFETLQIFNKHFEHVRVSNLSRNCYFPLINIAFHQQLICAIISSMQSIIFSATSFLTALVNGRVINCNVSAVITELSVHI